MSFKVSRKWRTSFEDLGPQPLDLEFTGSIARSALRGVFREGTTKSKIAWMFLRRRDPDVLDDLHTLEQVARCVAH